MASEIGVDERGITEGLARLIGRDAVDTDADSRADAMVDAFGGQRAEGAIAALIPIAVARPTCTDDVYAVVTYAREAGLAVVPRGGGTGLMGGARSVRPCIVVDLSRMDRVRAIDIASRQAWVEAGATLRSLDGRLRPHGLMIGHDPWTYDIATVGGAISTNGLGFLGGKYGSMGEQTLAVEAVLADGSVVETRPVQPRSTGVDLRSLFIGTEGQLGIVTAAAVRAFPIPESRERVGFRYPSFEAGFSAILVMHGLGLAPALLDFGDRPAEPAGNATLYLGFEGLAGEVGAQIARAREICSKHGGDAIEPREVEEFWSTRHAVAENFARARRQRAASPPPRRRAFDYAHMSLPPSQVLAYRSAAIARAHDAGAHVVETGIWVSPGLFSIVLAAGDESEEAATGVASGIDACLELANEYGGSIEYCHGVGLRLAHLMPREHGRGLDVMRAIKAALDPTATLNPDKGGLGGTPSSQ